MADNVAITAGSGTSIATDDVSGVHFQKVKINLGGDGVDGSTWAGAVTNAGTFAVQESGGSLTALQIMDDWDESDRAKANIIVGQAGVAAGAGAVSSTVQRVTLASDDPGVASLSVLDDWDESDRAKVNAAGSIADDSTTPNNPVMIGGTAKSPDGTTPGNVSAEDDVVRIITDLNRRIFVNTEHPQWVSYHSDGPSALTDQEVFADPGDGFQLVITEIILSTGAATALNVFFEEGSTKVLGPWYLEAVAGRGVHWKGRKHITASTNVTVTTSAAIAQSIDVQGYIQKV